MAFIHQVPASILCGTFVTAVCCSLFSSVKQGKSCKFTQNQVTTASPHVLSISFTDRPSSQLTVSLIMSLNKPKLRQCKYKICPSSQNTEIYFKEIKYSVLEWTSMMRVTELATAMETRDNKAKPDVSKFPFRRWRVRVLRCRFAVALLHSAVLTPCHEDLLTLRLLMSYIYIWSSQ